MERLLFHGELIWEQGVCTRRNFLEVFNNPVSPAAIFFFHLNRLPANFAADNMTGDQTSKGLVVLMTPVTYNRKLIELGAVHVLLPLASERGTLFLLDGLS